MLRKTLLVTLGCLFSMAAMAGACRGNACRYTYFDKDKDGCLEIRNAGPEDIKVTVYTAASGPIALRIASGSTEKLYKFGRTCVPAVDYLHSESQFDGGVFSPRA